MAKNQIVLGCKARDRVTGFEGIVVGKIEYLNGCVQFGIQPAADKKTGKIESACYFDDKQVEYLGRGVSLVALPTGGPSPYAPRS